MSRLTLNLSHILPQHQIHSKFLTLDSLRLNKLNLMKAKALIPRTNRNFRISSITEPEAENRIGKLRTKLENAVLALKRMHFKVNDLIEIFKGHEMKLNGIQQALIYEMEWTFRIF
ncbi:Hypothetical_protein [Hexamita inflata]|uniref:Hypothetical_protein n=1 Tax=Hexamita inflata TaxID=28002 RepID=A0AA86U567_9EUKA|nr:Hypothetical protein HINF_LOCUS28979 [Hexamita inflata]